VSRESRLAFTGRSESVDGSRGIYREEIHKEIKEIRRGVELTRVHNRRQIFPTSDLLRKMRFTPQSVVTVGFITMRPVYTTRSAPRS
jgi:hypothetical protein